MSTGIDRARKHNIRAFLQKFRPLLYDGYKLFVVYDKGSYVVRLTYLSAADGWTYGCKMRPTRFLLAMSDIDVYFLKDIDGNDVVPEFKDGTMFMRFLRTGSLSAEEV